MIRLTRAEVRKLRTTRLWIGMFIGALLLAAVGAIAILALANTDEGREAGIVPIETPADVQSLAFGGSIAVVFVMVVAATMATAEHRYGTAASTYLATPTRTPVVTAKTFAAIPVGIVFGISAAVLPIAIAAVWFAVQGDVLPYDASVLGAILLVGLQCAFGAVIAVNVGIAIRSQLVAILGVLGWVLVVEPLVGALVPSTLRWLPFSGVQASFGAPDPRLLGRPAAAGLMVVYSLTAWAIAVWLERRRDV
ncbi:MAG: hypothetical protein ACXWWX_04610 [Actinomycetota bacterium]